MDNTNENVPRWVDEHLSKLSPEETWQPDVTNAFARFEQRRTRVPARKWALAGAAIVAVCAAILAFPAPRVFAGRCVDACESLFIARTPPVTFATLNAHAAPDFTVNDATGAPLRLSDYKGQVVMLNFWATWCLPCKTEVPWFKEFEQAHRDQGFAVIGISLDDDGWKSVRPFIEAHQINYRVAIDDGTIAPKFGGVDSLPETILIDREGRIVRRHLGLVAKNVYESDLATLLKR